MALNHGLRRGHSLWNQAGQQALRALPLAPHASERRKALMTLYPRLQESIDEPFHGALDPGTCISESCAFIAGRTVNLALKARDQGSAIAGNSEASFISKNMYPVCSPLSSAK
jgi:hypothetical protein